MSTSVSFARLRRLALVSSSLAALGAGSQVAAQSYNAPDPIVVSGNVSINRGGPNEVYTINSPTAVLDFTPSDAGGGTSAINFQNANTSALYTGASNFTVLNRIIPASAGRAVQFNGTVTSRVNGSAGGSVWFYSPGGIIASPTSVFDVGNLLLTARDPANGGNSITSTTSFTGGGTGEAGVVINAGAQINALAEGSYIAMVAPRVVIDGNVRVNGQAILVAAEQAQLTINGGLFDITVNTGSDAGGGFPLQILGSVGGPASTGAGDTHAIVAMAYPKNGVVTALVGGNGNIGFDTATAAGVKNGRVVLYSGWQTVGQSGNSSGTPFGVEGDVHINGGHFTSDVTAQARRNAYAANTNGTAQFDGDVSLIAVAQAHIGARQAGVTMRIGGNVYLSATDDNLSGINRGGVAQLYTQNGGILDIAGNVGVYANAAAIDPSSFQGGNSAFGGTALILTQGGGSIRIGGFTTVDASVFGSNATTVAQTGATLRGGTASIIADLGDIDLVGGALVAANATGSTSASTTAAATVRAGTAQIMTSFGSALGRVASPQTVSIQANAIGDRSTVSGGLNGNAFGGTANAFVRGGNLNLSGALNMSANGSAASGLVLGSVAANGTGGSVQFNNTAGTATLGALSAIASGTGGTSRGGGNGVGGIGTGGNVFVQSIGTTSISGTANLSATGFGGDKTDGQTGGGGIGNGGNATLRANGGTLSVSSGLTLFASGVGGNSIGAGVIGNGGAGNGGGARVDTLSAGSSISVGGVTSMNAGGFGGNATVTTGSTGGAGTAGTDTQQGNFVKGGYVVAQGGAIALNGGLNLTATGFGGSGAIGGAGTGGLADIVGIIGSVTVGGSTSLDVSASGGNALSAAGVGGGAGGAATAGEIYTYAEASQAGVGRVQLGATQLRASATGGTGADGFNGGAGGAGGAAIAGNISARAVASSLGYSTSSFTGTAFATGGAGGTGGTGTGGAGGSATGGRIFLGSVSGTDLPANTGNASYGNVQLISSGLGGAGGAGAIGGRGGNGTGGLGEFLARGTAVTTGALTISSAGVGGDGGVGATTAATGIGGNGLGGQISLIASTRFQRTERGSLSAGAAQLVALGQAGTGAAGGTSIDGAMVVQATSATASFGSLTMGRGAAAAQLPPTQIAHAVLDVADGTITVGGALALSSNGDAVVSARDGGVLTAGSINASVRGNVLARPSNVATGTFGTIFANTTSNWLVNGDLTLASNLASGGNLTLFGRNITVGNIGTQGGVFMGRSQAGAVTDSIVTGSISAPLGYISGFANNTITTGALTAGDFIDLDARLGITINGSAVAGTMAASTQGPLPNDGGIYLYSESGPITTGDLTGQIVDVEVGDTDDVDTAAFSPAAVVRVGNVTAKAINITSIGSVTTGALTVTNNLYPRLALPIDELPILFVGALGNVTTGNVAGTTFGLLVSRDGDVNAGNMTFTGSAAVLAGRNITVGQVTTGRGANDLFYAAHYSVLNDPLLVDYFDNLLDNDIDDGAAPFSPSIFLQINPAAIGGALTIGGANTGTLLAGAQSIRIGATDASQRIALTATGLIDVTGTVVAPLIDFRSGDLDIGAQGRIGSAATTVLNLISTNQAGLILGGDGSGNGYRLSAAEAARLAAQRTVVTGPGAVTVRDLTLTGSSSAASVQNLNGSAASFEVRSGGVMRVEGAVTMTGAAATDRLNLIASTRIEVATDAGGAIALRGAQQNTLGGTLSFAAPVVAVGPNSTLNSPGHRSTFRRSRCDSGGGGGVATARRVHSGQYDQLFRQQPDRDPEHGYGGDGRWLYRGDGRAVDHQHRQRAATRHDGRAAGGPYLRPAAARGRYVRDQCAGIGRRDAKQRSDRAG